MRGLKRGLLGGLLLAIIVFFLPDGLLGAITVGTGLASVMPAAAPPLGTTARLLLAAAALVFGFGLTFWLVRRRKSSWDYDDDFDAEPLPASEQMVVSPAGVTSTATYSAPTQVADHGADAAAAPVAGSRASGDHTAILARIDKLEKQIGERLAKIDARLAAHGENSTTSGIDRERFIRTLAGIRRSIDGG